MNRSVNSTPWLSVVIPAYNEEKRLTDSLPVFLDYLRKQDYTWEVVVVDDGSHDKTSEVAKRLLADVPHKILLNWPNAGKGASIRNGMLAATGEWRLFSDADMSTPITEFDKFFKIINTEPDTDIIIGSRALAESKLRIHQPFYREFMGRIFNVCVQMLVLPGIHDTQCGFKVFRGAVADEIFPRQRLNGFTFDVELLMLARQAGYHIREYPIVWLNDSATKVNPIRDSIKMFLDLLRMKKRLKKEAKKDV